MKNFKYIFTVIITLFFSYLHAQIKPIETIRNDSFIDNPNTYYKDTNNRLANCVGTWEYNNGSDYFKITFSLVKELINNSYSIYQDKLKAKFIYKKNGVIKYDNYGPLYPIGTNVNTKPSIISSNFVLPSKISFFYTEPSATDCYRRRVGRLEIQFVTGTPAKLIWHRTTDTRYFHDGPCDDGSQTDDAPFIIPADMVLTKIN